MRSHRTISSTGSVSTGNVSNHAGLARRLTGWSLADKCSLPAQSRSSSRWSLVSAASEATVGGRSAVSSEAPILAPPDYQLHLLRDIPLNQIVPFLNRQMLYSKHLGLVGVVDGVREKMGLRRIKRGDARPESPNEPQPKPSILACR